jgi:tRNA 2-thiocytidine biosynthesis protein TtcA
MPQSPPTAAPATAELPHAEHMPSRTLARLQARLRGSAGKAIEDFRMIAPGDRVMVCLSGGKDSYTLLDILLSLQRSAPVDFQLLAVNLDQKQPGFPEHVLPQYLASLGVPFHIIEQDTYRVVKRVIPEGRTLCGLCSRLRRGALYRFAAENGITKIALGHHRDDIVETLFLNLFFGGRLKAMAPKLLSEDGRHIVIRPLAYVAERDIARYARGRRFPIIPCKLCGSQDNMQRVAVKRMLADWERAHPGRTESIFSALRHVELGHLADPRRFDFAALDGQRIGTPSSAPVTAMSLEEEDRLLAAAAANS